MSNFASSTIGQMLTKLDNMQGPAIVGGSLLAMKGMRAAGTGMERMADPNGLSAAEDAQFDMAVARWKQSNNIDPSGTAAPQEVQYRASTPAPTPDMFRRR